MRAIVALLLGLMVWSAGEAFAANILINGNVDLTYAQEIVPDFFLPKPLNWVNVGTRTLSGPYEDEMSSEPWAGPAPTPVTTDGAFNGPHPDGCGGLDCAVFFKAFSGNLGTGDLATGHLYQDVAATAGLTYTLSGWAGAEANFAAEEAVFRLLFYTAADGFLYSQSIDLFAEGLFTPNGEAFNYKQYSMAVVAPAGTAKVRVLVSMINGYANPAGGGQAFVVDDFTLDESGRGGQVPEPATGLLMGAGLAAVWWARRRR
jgi:hypothetical protein